MGDGGELVVDPRPEHLTFEAWLQRQASVDDETGVVARSLTSLDGWPTGVGRKGMTRWLVDNGHESMLEALSVLHGLYAEASCRPPFEPGNTVSVHHGAHSPRFVDPLASELVEMVLAQASVAHSPTSYLSEASYRPALWAWARAEAQAQLLTEYIARHALEAGDGVGDLDSDRVNRAYLLLHRAEARALTGRSRLGLDPLSRARLGADVASARVDLAKLWAGDE